MPNFEIQVQYLQTAQGKFFIIYVSSGSNNLEEMVMVLTCFAALLKRTELSLLRICCTQLCLLKCIDSIIL